MDHLGRVIGCPARRQGQRGYQPGKPHAAEVDAPRRGVGRELFVVPRVIPPELLAIQLVTSVHRHRLHVVVFAHAARTRFRLEIRNAVCGDRRGVHEHDRAAVGFALLLRELQQIQRAFDVHVVRGDRRELRTRRQQRRQVKHAVDFEFRENPFQQARIGNRTGEFPRDERNQRGIERRDVERDDGGAGGGKAGNEPVADFAARARNQHDRLSHWPAILAECPT